MRLIWTLTIAAWLAVLVAAAVEAFLMPTPPSSREVLSDMPKQVSLLPRIIVGTAFPESLTVWEGAQSTALAASGDYQRIRPILFADVAVYEVAGYLESPPNGSTLEMLESIWRDDGRKAYLLRFLIPCPGWQLRKAVHDEISRSFDDVPIAEHQETIERLLKRFEGGASMGDVFYLVRLPGNRVYLGVRDEANLELITDSPVLARAIWRMWAGPTAEPGRSGLVKRLAKSNP
jgi:hypothetical protein